MAYRWLLVACAALPLLSSCMDGKAAAARMKADSIEYFESGHADKAIQSAKDLASYDRNSANYLLGQYAIYTAAGNGLNFSSGLDENYRKILDIDEGAHVAYSSQYLVAKSFSRIFLHGDADAMSYFSSTCMTILQLDAGPCAWSMLNKFSSFYMTTHQRMDAVVLYEAATLAHDFHLADDHVSSFYRALALVRMNGAESTRALEDLELSGHFNPAMKATYCFFMQSEKAGVVAVDCSGSTQEMKELNLSARKKVQGH